MDAADGGDGGLKAFGQLRGEEVANYIVPVFREKDFLQGDLPLRKGSHADAADVRPAPSENLYQPIFSDLMNADRDAVAEDLFFIGGWFHFKNLFRFFPIIA